MFLSIAETLETVMNFTSLVNLFNVSTDMFNSLNS